LIDPFDAEDTARASGFYRRQAGRPLSSEAKEARMTADSLQKQSQGPAGRLFQKGQSGNPGGRRPEVACGRLLLDEGATLVGMKESKRRAMETIDLEKRLRALEPETPGHGV